eukprot:2336721-Rhodomonas_salina.1
MEFDRWSDTTKGLVNSFSPDTSFTGTSRTHGFLHLAPGTVYPNGEKIPRESLKVRICDSPWLMKHILEH